jgi:hypothetical protein
MNPDLFRGSNDAIEILAPSTARGDWKNLPHRLGIDHCVQTGVEHDPGNRPAGDQC